VISYLSGDTLSAVTDADCIRIANAIMNGIVDEDTVLGDSEAVANVTAATTMLANAIKANPSMLHSMSVKGVSLSFAGLEQVCKAAAVLVRQYANPSASGEITTMPLERAD